MPYKPNGRTHWAPIIASMTCACAYTQEETPVATEETTE